MFENLSLKSFTYKREPVLYVALLIAILNLLHAVLSGTLAVEDGLESTIALFFSFFVRGQVSPVNHEGEPGD